MLPADFFVGSDALTYLGCFSLALSEPPLWAEVVEKGRGERGPCSFCHIGEGRGPLFFVACCQFFVGGLGRNSDPNRDTRGARVSSGLLTADE